MEHVRDVEAAENSDISFIDPPTYAPPTYTPPTYTSPTHTSPTYTPQTYSNLGKKMGIVRSGLKVRHAAVPNKIFLISIGCSIF